jgi:hypothetical protein
VPQALMAELGKMAMVSGAAAKASAASFIPQWAANLPAMPSPAAMCRMVAREWPRVSLCAAVGLGLYLAYPYVPFIRADRHPRPAHEPEAREVRVDGKAGSRAIQAAAPETAPAGPATISGAALGLSGHPTTVPGSDK